MADTKRESVKAGIFVLVSLGVFAVFLLVLAGRSWFRSEKTYYTVFDSSVQGLDKGSPVKYLGVPAGTVSDIRFDEGHFPQIKVTLKIKEYVPIKEGTKAVLAMTTLTGIGSIELIGGLDSEQVLSDGARIPVESSFYQKVFQTIPEVVERLPNVLGHIEHASENLAAIFNIENQKKFSNALSKMEEAVVTLNRSIDSTSESVRKELAETAEVARAAIRETKDELGGTMKQIRESWDKVDRTVVRLESMLRTNDRNLSDTLVSLREAMREGKELMARLRQDPSELVFSNPVEEKKIPEPSEPKSKP